MSEKINYKIIVHGHHEIIEADRVEYMPTTGQTLFYLDNMMMHIAPKEALVANCQEEQVFIRQKKQIYEFILANKEVQNFWKGFLERNKYYDASDSDISEEDRIARIEATSKSKLLQEIKELIY